MIWVNFRKIRPHPAPAGEVPDRAEGESLYSLKNSPVWRKLSAGLTLNSFFSQDDKNTPSVAARHLPHEWGEDTRERKSGGAT